MPLPPQPLLTAGLAAAALGQLLAARCQTGLANATLNLADRRPCVLRAQPLLTAGLAAAVLGQLLAGRDVAAMGIILAGVACVIAAKLADDRHR
jgi:drug/metabolite transporter (DMT)-like permease